MMEYKIISHRQTIIRLINNYVICGKEKADLCCETTKKGSSSYLYIRKPRPKKKKKTTNGLFKRIIKYIMGIYRKYSSLHMRLILYKKENMKKGGCTPSKVRGLF